MPLLCLGQPGVMSITKVLMVALIFATTGCASQDWKYGPSESEISKTSRTMDDAIKQQEKENQKR